MKAPSVPSIRVHTDHADNKYFITWQDKDEGQCSDELLDDSYFVEALYKDPQQHNITKSLLGFVKMVAEDYWTAYVPGEHSGWDNIGSFKSLDGAVQDVLKLQVRDDFEVKFLD